MNRHRPAAARDAAPAQEAPQRAGAMPGLMPWAFAALLALPALDALVSGRDLSQQFLSLMTAGSGERPAVMVWAQRAVSLLLVVAAVQQFGSHALQQRRMPSPMLLGAFVLYWVGGIGVPMLLAAHPAVGHEYVYSLVFGAAACLVQGAQAGRLVRLARDALFVQMLAGLLLVPVASHLVLDLSYSQGLIRGLPRFGGLTPHPVTQGMLAQVALLLLWCHPYPRKALRLAAWALGLAVLFLAQSKTAWLAFAACAGVLLAVRQSGTLWQRISDPRGGGFGVLACGLLMLAVAGLAAWVLGGDAFGHAADLANSQEATQLMTLTGRDRIWAVAWQEWAQHPVFGYGLSIWDAPYRLAIGMPQATHAHNQFLDALSRSGSVGAAALLAYAVVLVVLALRGARASGGLSLALLVTIALRSISEVPLSLQGYGTELFSHLLLVAVLAAASAQRRPQVLASPMHFKVVSP